MSTFTPPVDWVGPTPWEDIAKAFDEQTPDGYPMQLVGDDAEAATAAVNQGIDPRLEAVTSVGKMEWKNTHAKFGFPKLHITLDRKGLLVFLRRLYEMDEEDGGAVGDAACNLRGSILQTLGIEEI